MRLGLEGSRWRFIGSGHRIAGGEPLHRQLELRIGKAKPRLPLPRTLVVLVVILPGDLDDAVYFRTYNIEGRVVEPFA